MKAIQLPDSRNETLLVYINGQLYPRSEAKVSVFDSVVQGGDAVWEGIRIYDGRVFHLEAHLDRLFDSAKALAFAHIPEREAIRQALFETLAANGMRDEAHVRLTLTRGEKVTSGMSPKWNQSGSTLIVLAEWKAPIYDPAGIRLITSSVRRNTPECLDSKIHHNNLLNNIMAKIEANLAGVDDAVMLDVDGFVSETNATNIFFVRKGVLLTPFADSCLPGITRGLVLRLAKDNQLPVMEKRISLAEMYMSEEAFTTGTMGELSPVLEIDGRAISSEAGPVTRHIQDLFRQETQSQGTPLPEF